MINRHILHDKVVDKFRNIAFNSIVSECFIGGLPIDSKHLDSTEADKLKDYMGNVLESLGGFGLLEKAIENATTEPQRDLLLNIYYVCDDVAQEAAKRVEEETDCKKETDVNTIVDSAEFTEEEYASFIKKSGNLSTDEIAEIIQEKTKQALINERDAYEKEEELEDELKSELANTKDFANESVNSYLDIVLEKDAPRHYISLFSKMQSRAMESVCRLKNIDDDYSYVDALNEFTFEAFLPELKRQKTVIEALESVIKLQELLNSNTDVATEGLLAKFSGKSIEDVQRYKVKLATLVSTIAYTAMESLKTLNLYSPSKDTIKKYIGSHDISLENAIENSAADVIDKAADAVDAAINTDYSKYSLEDLSAIIDRLTRIKELLEIITLNNADFLSSRTEILNSLSNTISKINKLIADNQADENEESSYYDKLKRSADIAQLNKVDNLFSKNPNVQEIALHVDPTSVSTVINVSALNSAWQVIGSTYITISTKVDSNKVSDYIKNIFPESNLSKSPKTIAIHFVDGSGRKIKLN